MHYYGSRSGMKMKKGINCLPLELLFDVLTCLPSKELLKLRVVCKLWNSIICDRSFHQHHLHQLRKNNIHGFKYCVSSYRSYGSYFFNSVNIRNSETLATIEEIKPCKSRYGRYIRGCVDGVLLANSNLPDHFENVVFLWNPTLRKVVDIPLDNSLKKTKYVTFGFGFDSVSNIYKVVAVSLENNVLKPMVYNLGSRSWTSPKVKSGSINNVKYLSSTQRFVNFQGCVYWLAKANKETHYLCFNLSTEALTCSKVPDVKCVDGTKYVAWRSLAVLHESLALVVLVVHYSGATQFPDKHIRVWIWRKDNTTSVFSWVELYNLDCGGKSFIYLTNNGNLYLQLWSSAKTVSVYDLKTGKEKVCSEILGDINFMDGYLESLALLR